MDCLESGAGIVLPVPGSKIRGDDTRHGEMNIWSPMVHPGKVSRGGQT